MIAAAEAPAAAQLLAAQPTPIRSVIEGTFELAEQKINGRWLDEAGSTFQYRYLSNHSAMVRRRAAPFMTFCNGPDPVRNWRRVQAKSGAAPPGRPSRRPFVYSTSNATAMGLCRPRDSASDWGENL